MPVGYLSGDTTVFSNVSLGDDGRLRVSRVSSSVSIVATEIWGSTVSGAFLARVVTAAAPTGLSIGELRVVFAASGISLVFSSGASYYIIGGSAASAAQA